MAKISRCRVVPFPDYQVAFLIDGRERVRWHYGTSYPRPFFFPFIGPSGTPLTRMGHPGAPDHDHHRSIWFAHEKVQGVNFWGDQTSARIRQKQWLAMEDGDAECRYAARLGWNDGHDPKDLLEQELIVAVRPAVGNEMLLEIQSTFRPTANSLEFGRTNFGFLAVRVANHLSEYFGGGTLTNDTGATGEKALFANPARWVDYSGPVPGDAIEGITYFDHPANPGTPTRWHVREDGWMGASVCQTGAISTSQQSPMRVRYLLHAHAGSINPQRAGEIAKGFLDSPPLMVAKSTKKHTHFEIRRGN